MVNLAGTVMRPILPSGEVDAQVSGIALTIRDVQGFVRRVDMPGLSAAAAVRQANARGWRVMAVEPTGQRASSTSPVVVAITGFPLLLFSQELLALLEAGLHLSEAIDVLLAKERQADVRRVLSDIQTALRQGKSFSESLCCSSWNFPELYLAAVRASERTGDLPQTLARFIAYQTQLDTIKKKLISSAIYPVALLVIGAFVTLFLLGYVVPRFASVYDSAGRDLPWLSLQLLSLGKLLSANAVVAALVALCVVFVAASSVWHHSGRAWWSGRLTRIPGLARRIDDFRMARLYRALSMLLASGIALPKALAMVTDLVSKDQQEKLHIVRGDIDSGASFSSALDRSGLSSPIADSLIKVGERSGQMADMLERLARFQDDDFARWLDWSSRLLEPVLMAVIGLVIGVVVVLLYMPIFDLAGALQ